MNKETTWIKRFFAMFSSRKNADTQNKETAAKSLNYIFDSIDKFSQKAEGRMIEKWPELAERIKTICKTVHLLEPDVSTLAGKAEQAIAQKITSASSACEVLFSNGDEKPLRNDLSDLERLVKQRMNPVSE